jgi:hypothetical protein
VIWSRSGTRNQEYLITMLWSSFKHSLVYLCRVTVTLFDTKWRGNELLSFKTAETYLFLQTFPIVLLGHKSASCMQYAESIADRLCPYISLITEAVHISNSRNSSVGIATGWTAGVRFPVEAKDFSLLHSGQTGSGAHPASHPLDTGDSFPGGKAEGPWSWSLTSM